jgi:hypothetical protein
MTARPRATGQIVFVCGPLPWRRPLSVILSRRAVTECCQFHTDIDGRRYQENRTFVACHHPFRLSAATAGLAFHRIRRRKPRNLRWRQREGAGWAGKQSRLIFGSTTTHSSRGPFSRCLFRAMFVPRPRARHAGLACPMLRLGRKRKWCIMFGFETSVDTPTHPSIYLLI